MEKILKLPLTEEIARKTEAPSVGDAQSGAALELMITDMLHEMGIPAHIKGHRYLRFAIMLAVTDYEIINSVTGALYPAIAERYSATPSSVERAIRNAIGMAWDRSDAAVLSSYFGYTIKSDRGRPTNSEFIAMISDRIILKMRSEQHGAAFKQLM